VCWLQQCVLRLQEFCCWVLAAEVALFPLFLALLMQAALGAATALTHACWALT
jgi:hypothetical protein